MGNTLNKMDQNGPWLPWLCQVFGGDQIDCSKHSNFQQLPESTDDLVQPLIHPWLVTSTSGKELQEFGSKSGQDESYCIEIAVK